MNTFVMSLWVGLLSATDLSNTRIYPSFLVVVLPFTVANTCNFARTVFSGRSPTLLAMSATSTISTDLGLATHHALRVAPLVRVAIRRSVGIMSAEVAIFSQVAHHAWIFGVIWIGLDWFLALAKFAFLTVSSVFTVSPSVSVGRFALPPKHTPPTRGYNYPRSPPILGNPYGIRALDWPKINNSYPLVTWHNATLTPPNIGSPLRKNTCITLLFYVLNFVKKRVWAVFGRWLV